MSSQASTSTPPSTEPTPGRGRGRGKSRGGLGKYLRARGRGRGLGRPAEFGKRLVLEGEEPANPDDDNDNDEEAAEAAAEHARKFSRRQLGTNADRYVEPEPELGSDGEPEVEPEVDLSGFLARQRLEDATGPGVAAEEDDEDEVDHTLAHISSHRSTAAPSKKGKVSQIEWDENLDEMSREKQAAEATWELKSRFRAKSDRLRAKPALPDHRKQVPTVIEAPPLPLPEGTVPQQKSAKEEMEDFLDDLLT